MNCCSDFGQCTQGANCPVRAAPTPVHILEFQQPMKDLAEPTDTEVAADAPMLPLSATEHAVLWTLISCLAMALCFGAIYLAKFIAMDSIQAWIAAAANYVTSILPMAPFF